MKVSSFFVCAALLYGTLSLSGYLAPQAAAAAEKQSKNSAAAASSQDNGFNAGVNLYKNRSYKEAAAQFEQVIKVNPANSDALYYCALSHQLSNNRARAKQLFEYITVNFPQSRVAPMSQTALNQLGGGSPASQTNIQGSSQNAAGNPNLDKAIADAMNSLTNPGAAKAEADLRSVPDLVRIPFEKINNDILVSMAVNGKPQTFKLDTGAFSVCMGANHLKEWGISTAEAKDSFDIGGVGDGKAKGWQQNLDLKLGPIYRRNFSCTIMDNMPSKPLLGQTFLKYFNVNVDSNSGMVLLAKKSGTAAKDMGRAAYHSVEIPFKRGGGGHMYVDIKINDRPFNIMFDTGCQQTSFALEDWKKLGFQIPADAYAGKAIGVLGETNSYYFNANSIKLGPIEQAPSPISVTEGSKDSLLGMSFYGKLKYTIDTNRSVIIFDDVR